MRVFNSQDVLAAGVLVGIILLLLLAGCAMDKFKMSFERGVVDPGASAPNVPTPSVVNGL